MRTPTTQAEAVTEILALAEKFDLQVRVIDREYVRDLAASTLTEWARMRSLDAVWEDPSVTGMSEDDFLDRVTDRVTADPSWKTLLLEAAGSEDDPMYEQTSQLVEHGISALIDDLELRAERRAQVPALD